MFPSTAAHLESCSLAIVDPATRLLYCEPSCTGPRLPVFEFDPLVRTAKALTCEVRERFGFNCLQLAMVGGSGECIPCAIFEILERMPAFDSDEAFFTLSSLADGALHPCQYGAIVSIFAGEPTLFGRFAKLGVIEDVRRELQAGGVCEVRQVNCGIDFNLFSFREDGDSYWFKAVGEPNTREYGITLLLSQRTPQYVPEITHAVPAWYGWIARHVDGLRLGERPDQWPCAFERLASLQQISTGFIEDLLQCGAADWRVPQLIAVMDPLFDELNIAMKAQTSSRVPPLSMEELGQLRVQLETSLLELHSLGVPDALVHGDLGHGNIVASKDGPIFLDWAESYISNPFLSAEYLLTDLQRCARFSDNEKASLLRSYVTHWAEWIPTDTLEQVVALTPAIGALSYAAVAFTAHRGRVSREQVWPLLRSLIRKARAEMERHGGVTA